MVEGRETIEERGEDVAKPFFFRCGLTAPHSGVSVVCGAALMLCRDAFRAGSEAGGCDGLSSFFSF